jgi:NADH-ubiquinone oxidoreductase chain 5
MVTAGVFLLARCSYFFEFSPFVLNFITIIGSTTAIFAATTGLFQKHMKKIISNTNCSQLGYMIFACGLSSYEVGLFHLSNHAFFKALLFLGAGSVIHAVSDEQDLRKLGGLKNLLPFSYSVMLIGSLALIGFPFLAGFYSKDIILEVSFAKYSIEGHFSFFLGLLAAFCTSFYSIRLLFLVFLANPNGNKNIILNAYEGSWKLTVPLFILTILSVVIGFLSKDLFIGFGTNFWGSSIFILPQNYVLFDIEFIGAKVKFLPLIITLFGCLCSFFLYSFRTLSFFEIKKFFGFKKIYNFFNKKWYFDRFYNTFFVQKTLNFSYFFSYQIIDRGILEKFGPFGITSLIDNTSKGIKQFQTGFIFHYLVYMFIFILLFFFFSIKVSFFLLILSLIAYFIFLR